ncbi:hypothetical protein [Vulcanisaeta thermophila]|uniref:hypothetical protein n=1 Tax=Vulcanisaeta thermophila TaxID=867917 RepID=UPI000852E3B0|nr:hypothetical protein [Vulcanisaeta thermophila]
MVRVVGLSMPHWETGFVGYVGGPEGDVEREYEEVMGRCYPLGFDLLREPKGKVICILDLLSRGVSVSMVAFHLDPYGVANELGSRFGVNRQLIINEALRWFVDYLVGNGYLGPNDHVEVDEELAVLRSYVGNVRIGGHASSLASMVASIPSLRMARGYELPVRVVDLKDTITRHVSERVRSWGSNQ